MNPWSFRRKAIYLVVAIFALLLVTVIPAVLLFYNQPTCFDGRQNGDETGVDCGGSCSILCSAEVSTPTILWSRVFRVTDNIYSAVAYVENPNINSEATARFSFRVYDANNILIATREGQVFIPRNKVIAIFEPNISIATGTPARTLFEFDGPIEWHRVAGSQPNITVVEKTLANTERPRVDAVVHNESVETVGQIEAVAIVYDNRANALGVSRTFIDSLSPGASRQITFTWPQPFPVSQEVCRVPLPGTDISSPESLGVMLAIDRSGSMVAQGTNPPQPLTDVKNAVISFIEGLNGTDRVGVVSFASEASRPIDSALSRDYPAVADIVRGISVAATGTQYTNIAEGIESSFEQFATPDQRFLTSRVIVLLTDGVANRPEDPVNRNYPEQYALEKAEEAKRSGIEIYTIGLGDEINEDFLIRLASTPDNYFKATTSGDLRAIYENIAVSFCSNEPSVVEIVTRVLPRD